MASSAKFILLELSVFEFFLKIFHLFLSLFNLQHEFSLLGLQNTQLFPKLSINKFLLFGPVLQGLVLIKLSINNFGLIFIFSLRLLLLAHQLVQCLSQGYYNSFLFTNLALQFFVLILALIYFYLGLLDLVDELFVLGLFALRTVASISDFAFNLLNLPTKFRNESFIALDLLHIVFLDLQILLLQLLILPLGLGNLELKIIIFRFDSPVVRILSPEGVNRLVSVQGFQVGGNSAVVGAHGAAVHPTSSIFIINQRKQQKKCI